MEYLISLEELNYKEIEEIEQPSLFEEDNIFDVINECPICKAKRQHLDWWTCKECSKKLSVEEYTKELIKYFS